MLSYALKDIRGVKSLLCISPLTLTDLISQQDLEKHLFSVSRQIVPMGERTYLW